MNWLLITIIAIVSRSFYSTTSKVFSQKIKVRSATQTVLLSFLAGIISIPFIPLLGGISIHYNFTNFIIILVIVLSQGVGNILYYRGLNNLDSGMAQISFSSILLWSAILSVFFLDSHFSFKQIVGITILMIAILIIQYQKGKLKWNKSMLLIIFSALLFAIFQVGSAMIAKEVSTGLYLLITYFGSGLIVLSFYYSSISLEIKNLWKTKLKETLIYTTGISFPSVVYFILSYFAYQIAPSRGIVIVLLTTQIILSVIFGIIFLKERDKMGKKLFAGALAVIAGMLIKS